MVISTFHVLINKDPNEEEEDKSSLTIIEKAFYAVVKSTQTSVKQNL